MDKVKGEQPSGKNKKLGILERLDAGEVLIGDGGYIYTLERRGYVMPVHWTPEVVCQFPDAVTQLGTEFCRAGADITQTCTYYSSGANLTKSDNTGQISSQSVYGCSEINKRACQLSKELSNQWGTLVGGSVTQTEIHRNGQGVLRKDTVQKELSEAMKALVENDVDFLMVEYFGHIEEMEWAIETAKQFGSQRVYGCAEINKRACQLSNELSHKWGTLVGGSVSQTEIYSQKGLESEKKKDKVMEELSEAIKVLVDNDVDFLLVEYFGHIEEMEWAIETAKQFGKPVVASMCIGPKGDRVRVSTLECARRMIRAKADVIGLNCLFDPFQTLEAMKDFKKAVDEIPPGQKKPHLMTQPNGYFTQDSGRVGWLHTDEFPFAMEPRHITRWDAAKYARQAYDLGIRFIGGCCGFEAYHIRAMAEELRKERGGKLPEASAQSDIGLELNHQRALDFGLRTEKWNPEFWNNLYPRDGRIPPQTNGTNGHKE